MRNARRVRFVVAMGLVILPAVWTLTAPALAQGKLAGAKSIRCTFPRMVTGGWKKDGAPDAIAGAASLVLRFEAIDADDGTAQLKNGSMSSDVIVRASTGYLHLMQVFRTGPLYTTTVFDKDTNGKLKAVHSRHEYFPQPLSGSTSSPEQYYGECEIVS